MISTCKLALGQVITPSLFNRLLKDVADDAEKALIMEAVLRSQTQAYYGPRNAGHFGLALGSYAHFTSPIRRYADLLVHRALVDAWSLEQPRSADRLIPTTSGLSETDRADLTRVSEAISVTERRAMEAERDTIDRYVPRFKRILRRYRINFCNAAPNLECAPHAKDTKV